MIQLRTITTQALLLLTAMLLVVILALLALAQLLVALAPESRPLRSAGASDSPLDSSDSSCYYLNCQNYQPLRGGDAGDAERCSALHHERRQGCNSTHVLAPDRA